MPTIGSVVKALHRAAHVWDYLTRRWRRLAMADGDQNRARSPTHPTWQILQLGFALAFALPPLTTHKTHVVRTHHKHTGYSTLKRMAVGVIASAQQQLDSEPASVMPLFLEGVMRQAEAAWRVQEGKRRLKQMTDAEERRLKDHQHVDHLAKTALGVFTSIGVTKGTLPPFSHVGDLLEYLCDHLEAIATEKGGIGQMMYDKWCKVYKIMPIIAQVDP